MPNAPERVVVLGKRMRAKMAANLENPQAVLKQIGAYIAGRAQKAFKDQRLGDFKWPVRYPNQKGPKINVAGVISDLITGSSIKKFRFVNKPALQGTGKLKNSLDPDKSVNMMGTHTVQVGTVLPYAAQHQWGLKSPAQPLTKSVRQGLSKFLKKKKNKQYRPILGPLFQRESLVTETNQRPFLGLTDEMQADIINIIQDKIPS